uniref:BAG domain-containing protein n=1 Tax=Attheya septentrionalis TaxID=420275 RepID=A0A7S2U8C1_9STRA|mmetsp:Transcript_12193/g.22147  ORF Transcript_12193/g.22147 Transcript_12193/m.22147 type:complete len:162 (+) Transcript_12193:194-679(+)
MSYSYGHGRLTTLMGVAAVSVTAIWTQRMISKYGVDGTLRLIWEGDHLKPEIREAMDNLDTLEFKKIAKSERKLEGMEVTVETARLNSIDETILETLPVQLKKQLAMLSSQLDALAADVDSIQSNGDAEVKRRKKYLSVKLVEMMERADKIIGQFSVEEQN